MLPLNSMSRLKGVKRHLFNISLTLSCNFSSSPGETCRWFYQQVHDGAHSMNIVECATCVFHPRWIPSTAQGHTLSGC
ncbi:hypothetical protein AV530_005501 [Patagioenas fasciata monilis]|uniref:Uncharacterized protein n=1 Tax=Patagioenas fasciata monilis TaxID=372326 RepID=A0A1V4JLN8_PATFA|nr:hypothetical protein AV530_005501 [Patagioenas fasciata monilis]